MFCNFQTSVTTKTHDIEGFPNPTHIRIVLAGKRMTDQVQFIPVDVTEGEYLSDEFRPGNADATVLCLDRVLTNNDYLAGEHFPTAEITALAEFAKVEVPKTMKNLRLSFFQSGLGSMSALTASSQLW